MGLLGGFHTSRQNSKIIEFSANDKNRTHSISGNLLNLKYQYKQFCVCLLNDDVLWSASFSTSFTSYSFASSDAM